MSDPAKHTRHTHPKASYHKHLDQTWIPNTSSGQLDPIYSTHPDKVSPHTQAHFSISTSLPGTRACTNMVYTAHRVAHSQASTLLCCVALTKHKQVSTGRPGHTSLSHRLPTQLHTQLLKRSHSAQTPQPCLLLHCLSPHTRHTPARSAAVPTSPPPLSAAAQTPRPCGARSRSCAPHPTPRTCAASGPPGQLRPAPGAAPGAARLAGMTQPACETR